MAFDIDIDHLYSAGERQFILYEYFQKHTGKLFFGNLYGKSAENIRQQKSLKSKKP